MKNLKASEIINLLGNLDEHEYYRECRVQRVATVKELIIALRTSTDPNVRRILCDMLGDRRAKTAVPTLIECLKDPSASVRAAAADSLGKIGSPSAGESLLVHFKQEKQEDARTMLAAALGAVGHRPAIPFLIEALSDPHRSLRGAAAWSLGVLRAEESVDALRSALAKETDSYPIARMEEALTLISAGDEGSHRTRD
jgi:HEAT repeat protein